MSRKRILLVDDDPLGVELALAAFEESRLHDRVQVARDGVEAIAYLSRACQLLEREDTLPDVLLLDLKMPRMDGLQVLERVRQDRAMRHLPVVILSSSREESDRRRSYELGANAYVAKPVDFDSFKTTVRRLARFWTEINEPPPRPGRKN